MLTVGFARRLATYKRLRLLLADAERALRLVDSKRPIQVVLAGKAHPRDDEGERIVQQLFAHKHDSGSAARVVYLDDYPAGSGGTGAWRGAPAGRRAPRALPGRAGLDARRIGSGAERARMLRKASMGFPSNRTATGARRAAARGWVAGHGFRAVGA